MNDWLKTIFGRDRYSTTLKKCGCVCHCPKCNNILNDSSMCKPINDDGCEYKYICSKCGHASIFDFGYPVPVLVK